MNYIAYCWECHPYLFVVLAVLVASIIVLGVWVIHYIRRERACNPTKGTGRIKCEAILLAIIKGMAFIRLDRVGSRNREGIDEWVLEIREFKRDIEIAELKKRKCRAKLPEMPDWKCSCGRINLAHTATCMCGKNMRDVPTEIRTNISAEEAAWQCLCGRKNAGHSSICSCGRDKQDVPLAVRMPSVQSTNTWRCICGRNNPSYTYTCVCGNGKTEKTNP